MSRSQQEKGAPQGAPAGSKRCPKCELELPLDDFYVKVRDKETGEIKQRTSWCKKCSNRSSNKSLEKARRDPLRGPQVRGRERKNWHKRARAKGVPESRAHRIYARKDDGVLEHSDARVSPGPFFTWLDDYMMKEHLSLPGIAEACGFSDESYIRKKRNQKTIPVGFVDIVLIKTGAEKQLWELYPDE